MTSGAGGPPEGGVELAPDGTFEAYRLEPGTYRIHVEIWRQREKGERPEVTRIGG